MDAESAHNLRRRCFGGKFSVGTVRTSETQREGKNMAEAAMAEWSGDSCVEEEEGEEEPLFADDLEDLPPLPPPMPSLSQLQAKSNVCTSLIACQTILSL